MPVDAEAPWFKYFPENRMWSAVLMGFLENAPWGGATLGEIDHIGKRLRRALGNNEVWFTEWSAMARHVEQLGDEAASRNRVFTAGGAHLRASMYYYAAERYLQNVDPRKAATYQKVLDCFSAAMQRIHPQAERVEIPYEGTTLPAYHYPAARKNGARSPAVVFFPGLDGTKEMLLAGAIELSRRGIACLMVDGPGQGEAVRRRGLASRYDYEVPAAAAVDYLETRADVDPQRLGVMGWSMGGYYAPRAAAFEKRFKACVAWGAHYDYHAVWVERRRVLESGGTDASGYIFQLLSVMGVKTADEALRKLEDFRLAGVAEKIECPILITHGEQDAIVPVEMAYRLYEHAGSKRKELKIFTAEEGGCEHIQLDNRTLGVTYVTDWLAEVL